MTWKEFLKTHWHMLAATDFFTVELWTAKGSIRYHGLFMFVFIGMFVFGCVLTDTHTVARCDDNCSPSVVEWLGKLSPCR